MLTIMSKLSSTMTGVYILYWSYLRLATTSEFSYCGRNVLDEIQYCSPGYRCCSTMRHTCCKNGTLCLGIYSCTTAGGMIGIILGSLLGFGISIYLIKCCCKACDPVNSSSIHPNWRSEK
nr:uncharacterized protein LOC117689420 [Crassostrea gigas]